MEIPIFNTLYDKKNKFLKTKKLDLNKLNDLKLHYIDKKKFPVTLILDKISNQNSLFETVKLDKKFSKKKEKLN